jgi:hypothetical protein
VIWGAALETKTAPEQGEDQEGAPHASCIVSSVRALREIPRTCVTRQLFGEQAEGVEAPGEVEVGRRQDTASFVRGRSRARRASLVEPRPELRAALVGVELDGEGLLTARSSTPSSRCGSPPAASRHRPAARLAADVAFRDLDLRPAMWRRLWRVAEPHGLDPLEERREPRSNRGALPACPPDGGVDRHQHEQAG